MLDIKKWLVIVLFLVFSLFAVAFTPPPTVQADDGQNWLAQQGVAPYSCDDVNGDGYDDLCGVDNTTDCGGSGCPYVIFGTPPPPPPTAEPIPSNTQQGTISTPVIPTEEPTPIPIPTQDISLIPIAIPANGRCSIAGATDAGANIRKRPTTQNSDVVDGLTLNEITPVVGYFPNGTPDDLTDDWWFIEQGWVANAVVRSGGTCDARKIISYNQQVIAINFISDPAPNCPELSGKLATYPVYFPLLLPKDFDCTDIDKLITKVELNKSVPLDVSKYPSKLPELALEGSEENPVIDVCDPTTRDPQTNSLTIVQSASLRTSNAQINQTVEQVANLGFPKQELTCDLVQWVNLVGVLDETELNIAKDLYNRVSQCPNTSTLNNSERVIALIFHYLLVNGDLSVMGNMTNDELCNIKTLPPTTPPTLPNINICGLTVEQLIRSPYLSATQKWYILTKKLPHPIYSRDTIAVLCQPQTDGETPEEISDRILDEAPSDPINVINYPVDSATTEAITTPPNSSEVLGLGVFQANSANGQSSDIYVILRNETKSVTPDTPGSEIRPSLSPDGLWVAYLVKPAVEGGNYQLYITELQNSQNPLVVVIPDDKQLIDSRIAWSPDRKQLLISLKNTADGVTSIYQWSIEKSEFDPNPLIIGARSPIYNPQGTLIAYEICDENNICNIYTNTPDGASEQAIQILNIDTTISCQSPIFGAASLNLYFICIEGNSYAIYRYGKGDTEATRIMYSSTTPINGLSAISNTDILTFDDGNVVYRTGDGNFEIIEDVSDDPALAQFKGITNLQWIPNLDKDS